MEFFSHYNQSIAVLIARIFLGVLFVFQGYDAVFNIKVKNVVAVYEDSLINKGFPRFVIFLGAWFTSYSELVGGILLLCGLFESFTCILLGANLIVASIAFSINTPMWDMRHVFPRLALLIFLLLAPSSWNFFTLDNFFN